MVSVHRVGPLSAVFLTLTLFIVLAVPPAIGRELTVAVVRDGVSPEGDLAPAIEAELGRLLESGRAVSFPARPAWTGDWDPASVGAALDDALADSSVDVVLVTGVLGLQAAVDPARRLSKPVVSGVVLGSDLFGLGSEPGRAAHPNLVPLISPNLTDSEIRTLLTLVPYARLHVAIGREYAEHVTTVPERAREYGESIGVDVRLLPLDPDPASFAAIVPDSGEAVLLAPAPRLSADQRRAFLTLLTEHGVRSISVVGHADVELGALGAITPDYATRVTRRVALNLNEIANGTPPTDLPAELTVPPTVLLNGRTLAALGIIPSEQVRMLAEILHPEALDTGVEPLSLEQAMRRAEEGNATLSVATAQYEGSVHDVGRARSPLLPQVEATGSYLNADPRTLEGLIPDHSVSVGVGLSQMLYDDRRVSDYRATSRLRDSAEQDREAVRLDVVSDAGRRFLRYVLARILVRIQEANVRLTEENLALARRRFEVGYSGRDEVFRWEAQLAQEQSKLLQDGAVEAAARIRLNQALGVAQGQVWAPEEIEIDSEVFPFLGGAIDDVFDDPRRWSRFEDLAVTLALENAPELRGLGFAIDAQGIRLGERKRSFIVPSLMATFRYDYMLDRDPPFVDVPDDFHYVEIAARLPLLEGGLRLYDVRKTRSELLTLERQQTLAAQIVEERARTAVRNVTSSFPVIRLARDGAASSTRNLEVVRDKYAQGIVNVTDLLSAQTQSNQANQSAAAAVYAHVSDLLDLQRAIAWIDAERTIEEREALVGRIRESTLPAPPAAPNGEE